MFTGKRRVRLVVSVALGWQVIVYALFIGGVMVDVSNCLAFRGIRLVGLLSSGVYSDSYCLRCRWRASWCSTGGVPKGQDERAEPSDEPNRRERDRVAGGAMQLCA
jgi:hypothetical protein